jgi:hypothetical protein
MHKKSPFAAVEDEQASDVPGLQRAIEKAVALKQAIDAIEKVRRSTYEPTKSPTGKYKKLVC